MQNYGLLFIGLMLLVGVLANVWMHLDENGQREDTGARRVLLQQATLKHLDDIRQHHKSDCKADTSLWVAVSSAENRVDGMRAILEHNASAEVVIASIEAGTQLTGAYETAFFACRER